MSNTDRFFYLNSTVFLLGYMMIIIPPYSDMGHILYIPWILRINLFKPSNPSKIHGIYDQEGTGILLFLQQSILLKK
jgi:hypothetical protein